VLLETPARFATSLIVATVLTSFLERSKTLKNKIGLAGMCILNHATLLFISV
jgi:hypothetical protein